MMPIGAGRTHGACATYGIYKYQLLFRRNFCTTWTRSSFFVFKFKFVYNAFMVTTYYVDLKNHCNIYIVYFVGGQESVGHSFAYVAHFLFLRDAWIRTQRSAIASRSATNLATHLYKNNN